MIFFEIGLISRIWIGHIFNRNFFILVTKTKPEAENGLQLAVRLVRSFKEYFLKIKKLRRFL